MRYCFAVTEMISFVRRGFCLFYCHLFYSVKGDLHCRNAENNHGDHAFNQNVGVVINNRIEGRQGFREIVRHILHPIQVSAKGMECTSQENSQKIPLDKSVLLSGKHTGNAQCGKCKKVIAAYLKGSQYVGTATL